MPSLRWHQLIPRSTQPSSPLRCLDSANLCGRGHLRVAYAWLAFGRPCSQLSRRLAVLLLATGGQREEHWSAGADPSCWLPSALPAAGQLPWNPQRCPSATGACGGTPASTISTRSLCCSGEPVPSAEEAGVRGRDLGSREPCLGPSRDKSSSCSVPLRKEPRNPFLQVLAQLGWEPRPCAQRAGRVGWPGGPNPKAWTPTRHYCWPNPQAPSSALSLFTPSAASGESG